MSTYTIRPGYAPDLNFIKSSWVRSMRHAQDIRPHELHTRIERLLASSAAVLVLTEPETPDIIVGWICFDAQKHIHFVFVREEHRRRGLATRLVELATPSSVVATHQTPISRRISRSHEIQYKPWLLDAHVN